MKKKKFSVEIKTKNNNMHSCGNNIVERIKVIDSNILKFINNYFY